MARLVKFGSSMEAKTLKALKAYTRDSGRTMAAVLKDAVAEYLDRVRVRPKARAAIETVLDEHRDLLERLAK